jgi:hypothetical protein
VLVGRNVCELRQGSCVDQEEAAGKSGVRKKGILVEKTCV